MTNKQLIKKLETLPKESAVMIGFDSGIRMDVDIVALTKTKKEDIPEGSIVLTSIWDYDAIKKWHSIRKI